MAKWNKIMVLLVFQLLYYASICKFQTYNGLMIDYFENCPDRTLPNRVENQTIIQLSRDKIVVNADIEVTKITRKLPALIKIYKCPSRSGTDCETFLRVTQKDFCRIFTEKGQFWSAFYEKAVTPRVYCPIKKGRYMIRNGTIDLKMMLQSMPPVTDMQDYYWKFRTQLFTPDKEELFCVTSGGRLLKFRKN
ncbi:unnamed protein product [Nezara viridula]|uniref:Uncharacterized protein n=1 Tax=Nezara viridula TaxID=85310 RepID=A0A9P0HEW9_NEZVI|nr:unnamed protein product [Nezara viridula]